MTTSCTMTWSSHDGVTVPCYSYELFPTTFDPTRELARVIVPHIAYDLVFELKQYHTSESRRVRLWRDYVQRFETLNGYLLTITVKPDQGPAYAGLVASGEQPTRVQVGAHEPYYFKAFWHTP